MSRPVSNCSGTGIASIVTAFWHDYLPTLIGPWGLNSKVIKKSTMGSVNIDTEDNFSINDFESGNSMQVRVVVAKEEKPEYDKGKKITVVHEGKKMTGKIVSDPILVDRKREDGRLTLSLIVEKD